MKIDIVLGFDYGTKKIGVAVANMITRQASPIHTMKNIISKPDWQGIAKLVAQWDPQLCVVGLPCHGDGEQSRMTARSRRFGNQLAGRFVLPVVWVNEYLSSYAVETQQYSKKYQDAKGSDAIAAKLILDTWLSEFRGQ